MPLGQALGLRSELFGDHERLGEGDQVGRGEVVGEDLLVFDWNCF